MMLQGFGNHHQSEAEAGLLPSTQNSPQQCTKGLYPEQINGSAFTRARHQNYKTWLYRRYPSVCKNDFSHLSDRLKKTRIELLPPDPMRWNAQEMNHNTDFIDGLTPIAHSHYNRVYLYHFSQGMGKKYFYNQDGEMLFVPYQGHFECHTELGTLHIGVGSILVIPRGIYFRLKPNDGVCSGYICENMGSPLSLPQLGPIGANGLAHPRHFHYPQAEYEPDHHEACLVHKFQDQLWMSHDNPTPLNVAAWHGNYAPYSYDLSLFNTINTVSFDHPDPSIFTVLTSESNTPGVANLDFVIFPKRWMVAEHSFRPPYFHRNIMSELMGLIHGSYDAKAEGFLPGGVSIHNAMSAHGPDLKSTSKAMEDSLSPMQFDDGLAFMFESCDLWQVEKDYYNSPCRQASYTQCWQGFAKADI